MRRRLGLVACGCVLAMSMAQSASAATPHPLLGAITGQAISSAGELKGACGLAVDSAQNVYVADYYQHRVVIFSGQRKFVTQILSVDPGNGPCDLAVGASGALFVNTFHGEVIRLTPSEYPPTSAAVYDAPVVIDPGPATGVAVDPATGNLYVNRRDHVAAYLPTGEPLLSEGSPVRLGLGALGDSYGVTVSAFPATEGRVYVGDAGAELIKAFDPASDLSSPVMTISGEGTPQGRFHLTDTDLAVDPSDGHLYVADNLQPHFEEPEAVVDEFSPGGHYRGRVPHPLAVGESSFLVEAEPTSLAIHAENLLVTSGNYEDSVVYIFGPPSGAPAGMLTVSKSGSGEGRVVSLPAGIACGLVCEGEFELGSTVVLTASPSSGSVFAGWSGCEVPEGSSCAVEMEASRSVNATFETAPTQAAGPAAIAAPLGGPVQIQDRSSPPRSLSTEGRPRRKAAPRQRRKRPHRRGWAARIGSARAR